MLCVHSAKRGVLVCQLHTVELQIGNRTASILPLNACVSFPEMRQREGEREREIKEDIKLWNAENTQEAWKIASQSLKSIDSKKTQILFFFLFLIIPYILIFIFRRAFAGRGGNMYIRIRVPKLAVRTLWWFMAPAHWAMRGACLNKCLLYAMA